MPNIPTHIIPFQINDQRIDCVVPIADKVASWYQQQLKIDSTTPFPYWAKVWPAAWALSKFITQNSHYVQQRNVLELAAGIGLPGFIAARYAASVTISDYIPEALDVILASINHQQLTHVQTTLLNWNQLPDKLDAEVIIMSDINYDPNSFDVLYTVIKQLINANKTLLLSTPQRLWSKPFLERLAPWFKHQQEFEIIENEQITYTTVWVLYK